MRNPRRCRLQLSKIKDEKRSCSGGGQICPTLMACNAMILVIESIEDEDLYENNL